MTVRPICVVAFAALALAACQQSPEDGADAADAPGAGETAMPVEPDGGIGDGAQPLPETVDAIPEAFLGVWDYVKGSCDPASDLRVEIGPRTIGFYESHGEVTRVEVDGPNRIVVSLAMEGEGERWTMARLFTLSEDGQTLTPAAADAGEQLEPMPLKRCTA